MAESRWTSGSLPCPPGPPNEPRGSSANRGAPRIKTIVDTRASWPSRGDPPALTPSPTPGPRPRPRPPRPRPPPPLQQPQPGTRPRWPCPCRPCRRPAAAGRRPCRRDRQPPTEPSSPRWACPRRGAGGTQTLWRPRRPRDSSPSRASRRGRARRRRPPPSARGRRGGRRGAPSSAGPAAASASCPDGSTSPVSPPLRGRRLRLGGGCTSPATGRWCPCGA
mmetsp:Transcript_108918/g.302866  ORF Transcript_108918/g.302866 Transcript_108918/m.302866 type:complete len:221 (+) Transcript_108918:172-834(+)